MALRKKEEGEEEEEDDDVDDDNTDMAHYAQARSGGERLCSTCDVTNFFDTSYLDKYAM